jgi:hypothetical protein
LRNFFLNGGSTRVFVRISVNNTLEVSGETSTFTQFLQNLNVNPLGRGRILEIEKNTLRFEEK